MKSILACFSLLFVFACSGNKQDEPRKIKEIVCGDSVEQELFDEQGNAYFMKLPGKCDTIYEGAE